MAQIRFVDDWLRSPAAPPSHWRSVMVIAEKWAEQRVLMRAYAESRDQTRPTIMLHGIELAIGPAGIDVNGAWGIHVGESPDGRAQEIKTHFESAARRMAGSKGNPPRLQDEESTFDREPTANWGPGAPRILPSRTDMRQTPVEYAAQTPATRIPQNQIATYVSPAPSAAHYPAPQQEFVPPTNPAVRPTPLARTRIGRTRPPPFPADKTLTDPSVSTSRGTALGYTSGAGAQSAVVRLGLAPGVSARLGRLVDRVVPTEFHIDTGERKVLNALGEKDTLTARAIGQMLDMVDAVSFMEELIRKLEGYNLDLIEPADPEGGEPTYKLRR